MEDEVCVYIRLESDIVSARQKGRELATPLGFSSSELTTIATAISELARNIVDYAGNGEIKLSLIQQHDRKGISIVARDNGPGIPDIDRAMQDGYSTGGSLGLGLPGTRRLMDDFQIVSEVGKGTTVTVRKWRK
ncbi:MAG: anti-sigma regulatory factor [Dehalobacterium sp.]